MSLSKNMTLSHSSRAALAVLIASLNSTGCSASRSKDVGPPDDPIDGGEIVVDGDIPTFDLGGISSDAVVGRGPGSCEEAEAAKSNVGCDYWPTVVANPVASVFDFAVVVANAGDVAATITVTGPGGLSRTATAAAGELTKIYLPWVNSLKGPGVDSLATTSLVATVRANKSAYHLVSSRPVTVYQFSALEYQGKGGPAGKSWASCPDLTGTGSCFSYSNDASLLLPSTALTGNYRVSASPGWKKYGAYLALTGVRDGTNVTVKLGAKAEVIAGGGISSAGARETVKFTLNAGDVVELVASAGPLRDFSGSLVQADKPVQAISGVPCVQMPDGKEACDHIEELVLPAETLGSDYLVTVPTGPRGNVVGHVVRIYGNVDTTKLTYSPKRPAGAPEVVNAGDVADLGIVAADFRVTSDRSFAVGSFMLSASLLDPSAPAGEEKGDPSQSVVIPLEQYRTDYVFLAPGDYDVNYADIVAPTGTSLQLDGSPVTTVAVAIGSTGFGTHRVKLSVGKQGAHRLLASKPVGLQVMGYGKYTSYQYPGGLDLKLIAAPPPK